MKNTDVYGSGGVGVTAPEHEPLWAIGLSVLLIAFVFARRRSGDASSVRGEDRQGETGRGRSADTPSEIAAQGWKDIILRVYRGISENRILLVAAGVTFYALLAIFSRDRGLNINLRPVRRPGQYSQPSRHDGERRTGWSDRPSS